MRQGRRQHAGTAPLASWVNLHPVAVAVAEGERVFPAEGGERAPRSAALAAALTAANRRWGNAVDAEVQRWLDGAEAVVTGQQPGLAGGPLLTLVKACAVAAEVRRSREAGRDAVGFLWLATTDDDLPEMGWARIAVGEALEAVQEEGWSRGDAMAAATPVGPGTVALLDRIEAQLPPSDHVRDALALARECYAPGVLLGEGTARFLARLLRGLGVVIVDASEPELARSAAGEVAAVLERLVEAWRLLEEGAGEMKALGWPLPLKLTPGRLPVFRVEEGHRRRLATTDGACPAAVLEEVRAHPGRFVPNVWLRPLVQDTALGTEAALLGGAELAYHVQGRALWRLAGVGRPAWRLRPHVTVVTGAERRLVRQLGLEPEQVLRARPPAHLLPGRGVRRRSERLRGSVERAFAELEGVAGQELPNLTGDLEATRRKVEAALAWWEGRADRAAVQAAEVDDRRWRRLRAFLRPEGGPQERGLSVLAAVLRLGLDWPAELAAAVDPGHPGMHLLCWEDGGPW